MSLALHAALDRRPHRPARARPRTSAWHAGNWYVNAKSIGLEHEGFLGAPGAWYTEAMYRASARLVRYLAAEVRHPAGPRSTSSATTTCPAPTASTVRGMHTDPGPYWDWQHYFDLLGRPFTATATPASGAGHHPARTTPATSRGTRAASPAASPARRTAPRGAAHRPAGRDAAAGQGHRAAPGRRLRTIDVNDLGARASTGQRYAVADRSGDWTAIWYLGQKAWFQQPARAPTAVNASGRS